MTKQKLAKARNSNKCEYDLKCKNKPKYKSISNEYLCKKHFKSCERTLDLSEWTKL